MSVSEEIIKVLDALASKFGIAVNWTSQNIVPYLEQLSEKCIYYEIVTSIIWFAIGIIFVFVCGTLGIKGTQYCYKKSKETEWNDWDVGMMFAGIGTVIVVILGGIIIIHQLFNIVTCLTFPEKIILEELSEIYKSL